MIAFRQIKRKEGMHLKKDVVTKLLEEYPDVFADIGNVNLYDGKPVILPDELEPLPSTLFFSDTNGEQRELRSDIRMRHKKNGIDISVICLETIRNTLCEFLIVRGRRQIGMQAFQLGLCLSRKSVRHLQHDACPGYGI